jgi:hypothetical protein
VTTIILLNCILTIIITIRECCVRTGNEILMIHWTVEFAFNIALPTAAKSDEPPKNATIIPGRPTNTFTYNEFVQAYWTFWRDHIYGDHLYQLQHGEQCHQRQHQAPCYQEKVAVIGEWWFHHLSLNLGGTSKHICYFLLFFLFSLLRPSSTSPRNLLS